MNPPKANIGTDIGPLFLTPVSSNDFTYNLTPNIIQNPMAGPVIPAGVGWTVPGISGGGLSAQPMSTSKGKKSVGK